MQPRETFVRFEAKELAELSLVHHQRHMWLDARVASAHSDLLRLFPAPRPDLMDLLTPDTSVRMIRVANESVTYAEVVALETDAQVVVLVQPVDLAVNLADQRAFRRIRLTGVEARLACHSGGRAVSFRVNVTDISGSGARVLSARAVEQGDPVQLSLTVRESSLQVLAEVVWVRRIARWWQAGIRFTDRTLGAQDGIVRQLCAEDLRRARPHAG